MFFFFKAIHVVGFVSWFAGMFYLGRMFVYHSESLLKPEPEKSILNAQLSLMENRVYKIICNPAMIITWICGIAMLYIHGMEWLKASGWMHVKLLFVFALSGYQGHMKKCMNQLQAGKMPMNNFRFRLYNEIPTLFLVFIALLAVYKSQINYLYAFLGMIEFAIILIAFTKLYKYLRNKKNRNE